MNAVSKKLGLLFMSVVVVSVAAIEASAQSSTFGSQQTNLYKTRSSSNFYSSDQIQRRIRSQSVSRDLFAPRLNNSSQRRASKPFSGLNRGPTVSPYLALNSPFSQGSDYYNIVRPLQEQDRINRRQQRINQRMQRENLANRHRLNQMAATGPFDPKGSEDRPPTGHPAGRMQYGNYLNTGGYFVQQSAPKRE